MPASGPSPVPRRRTSPLKCKQHSVIRGARSGVEYDSRCRPPADPSGEIAGIRQVGVGIVGDHRPLAGCQCRCAPAPNAATLPGTGRCQDVTTNRAVGADVEFGLPQCPSRRRGEVGRHVRGHVDVEQMRLRRARGRDPSTASDTPVCRTAVTLLSLRSVRSRRSSSSFGADGSIGPRTTVSSASTGGAHRLTPPGKASASCASPPAAGSRHNAAGGLSSSSLGRTATNKRSPSAVNTGDDSPFAPRVRRAPAACRPDP